MIFSELSMKSVLSVVIKMNVVLKRILQVIAGIVAVTLVAFLILLLVLTVTEYKPDTIEELSVNGQGGASVHAGDTLSVLTWNTGYGALGNNADFFMDGGSMVNTADEDRVQKNMAAINDEIAGLDPDVVFLQEVDRNSKRSHGIDELDLIREAQSGYCDTFANNYKVVYVPYPLPTIGKVDSGIVTLSKYEVKDSRRFALPCPFSYPIRTANLKRCLMIDRVPVEGSDKELVLVNLHLEAYDDGDGKAAQTQMLQEILQEEVNDGNYVIAGGDFNQAFSGVDTSMYPKISEDLWQPGEIDTDLFGEDLTLVTDNSAPSCRSLDQPYVGADHEKFQYYLIDGFIVSGNVTVESVETQNLNFKNSDHNPILMKVTLD